MASLKNIRQRIDAVKGISQVTRAMKLVAAVRLKKSQESIEQARPYAFGINGVLKDLLPVVDRELHRFLEVRPPEKIGFIILTADRGLCAGFNSNVIHTAREIMSGYERERVRVICVGRKGSEYFGKRGWNVIGEYTGFWRELKFSHAVSIVDRITTLYVDHDLDRVEVIFNEFKNVLRQEVVRSQFLPLVVEEGEGTEIRDYLFEPSVQEIVTSLVPRHLNVQMWRFLLESNAAEQAARMMAMDSATENAMEMITGLTLQLNKARQADITKEILEVVGGAEALRFQDDG